jgi:hypothetical protein
MWESPSLDAFSRPRTATPRSCTGPLLLSCSAPEGIESGPAPTIQGRRLPFQGEASEKAPEPGSGFEIASTPGYLYPNR